MILGEVGADRILAITLSVDGREWRAVIDTGFNGDVELPESLRAVVRPRFTGRVHSLLAGGHVIEEDSYLVDFPFDGAALLVEATFVDGDEILIGTRLLEDRRLSIDFVSRIVEID